MKRAMVLALGVLLILVLAGCSEGNTTAGYEGGTGRYSTVNGGKQGESFGTTGGDSATPSPTQG